MIVPLDWRSGQLKSTLSGCYRLPYFVYTGCPTLYGVEEAGLEEEDLFYMMPPSSTPAPAPPG